MPLFLSHPHFHYYHTTTSIHITLTPSSSSYSLLHSCLFSSINTILILSCIHFCHIHTLIPVTFPFPLLSHSYLHTCHNLINLISIHVCSYFHTLKVRNKNSTPSCQKQTKANNSSFHSKLTPHLLSIVSEGGGAALLHEYSKL